MLDFEPEDRMDWETETVLCRLSGPRHYYAILKTLHDTTDDDRPQVLGALPEASASVVCRLGSLAVKNLTAPPEVRWPRMRIDWPGEARRACLYDRAQLDGLAMALDVGTLLGAREALEDLDGWQAELVARLVCRILAELISRLALPPDHAARSASVRIFPNEPSTNA